MEIQNLGVWTVREGGRPTAGRRCRGNSAKVRSRRGKKNEAEEDSIIPPRRGWAERGLTQRSAAHSSDLCDPKAWNTEPKNQATRVRTLILLMRWSGMAIGDAVSLERSRLTDNNEIFLRRAKTGQPVYVPIPPDVADALRNIPPGPAPNPDTSSGVVMGS